jgi:uncharacterized protein (TIGR00375 family)
MRFVADFHIHSRFSIATSKLLVPEHLDYWGRLKGIGVVGTGDFTHPGWVKELKEKLVPAEPGLFRLRDELVLDEVKGHPWAGGKEVRFVLTAEISNIYKRDGQVRKVHNVMMAPDFESVEALQRKLVAIGGNITSDGRPILGLDSRDLLEMGLEASERMVLIPAHIWTPWFSAMGSKSGFDSIQECYGDLAGHVFAVETGLSTDPPMNWMCRSLDGYTLLSNSDAHSPDRLGRNANIFDCELSYEAIVEAMRRGDGESFIGTIDMFPQEGKYHYDGHRKCGVRWDPVETLRHRGICSVCGKRVTVGVTNRVVELSDREDILERPNRRDFYSIIPLKEMVAEMAGVGPNSKRVNGRYHALLNRLGPELDILLRLPEEELRTVEDDDLLEAICRMRSREVFIQEGFDGEYGIVKAFARGESRVDCKQGALFGGTDAVERSMAPRRQLINFDLEEYRRLAALNRRLDEAEDMGDSSADEVKLELNERQMEAARHGEGPALVIAGPGTGKTRVLTSRIVHLIEDLGVKPSSILAVTFTNRAATEMGERLLASVKKGIGEQVAVMTFHRLGLAMLKRFYESAGRSEGFSLVAEDDVALILKDFPGFEKGRLKGMMELLGEWKRNIVLPEDVADEAERRLFVWYEERLRELNLFDLADLIYWPVRLLEQEREVCEAFRERFEWVMVDEYQDINGAQFRLLKGLMPGAAPNLCVIGDPDQAIYGFRGADVGLIRGFMEDYPAATMFRLEKSYRCSDSILLASNGVVGGEIGLEGLGQGVKVNVVENPSHRSEAEFVARSIERMMGGLRFFSMDSDITEGNRDVGIESLSDFAILCRVKGQFEAIEKALLDHSVPFQTVGEEPFVRREPARTVIDGLKWLLNPGNRFLEEKMKRKGTGTLHSDVSIGRKSVARVLKDVAGRCLAEVPAEDKELLKRLYDFAVPFGRDVDGFMAAVDLGVGSDVYRKDLERVSLMTMHASKGLEFKCVFVVGCEEGLIPYSLFETLKADEDEERRLLYVAMTRAKDYLILTHSLKRMLRGREYQLPRSGFIQTIHRELVEMKQAGPPPKECPKEQQLSLFD